MGTSHALLVPGLRTHVAAGWRADVASVSGTIRAHPQLLVIGMIGFALRGGIVLLTLPILVLPTSVEVRLLLGSSLGTTGLTSTFYLAVAVLSAVTLGLALAVLYVLARCELSAFTRFVHSAQPSAEHAWLQPRHLDSDELARTTSRLFVVQTLTLLAVLIAALPLAGALAQSTYQEIVLPSSAQSIYSRIFSDVAVLFVVFLVALLFIEAISAIATRRVLAGAFGLRAHQRIARHPLRVLAVAVAGWTLFIGAVALAYGVLSLTWQAVESVFLSTGLSADLRDLVSALVVGPPLWCRVRSLSDGLWHRVDSAQRTLDARVTALNL